MVVLVFGLPGSGKSYFASRLAAQMGAEYINSDQLRLMMFPVRTYSNEEKQAVYEAMLSMAKGRIRQGKNVVIDATFHRHSLRTHFMESLKGELIWFIEVVADEETIRKRLSMPRQFSEADYAVYEKIRYDWEPMTEPHLVLDSSEPVEKMLLQAVRYLSLTSKTGKAS